MPSPVRRLHLLNHLAGRAVPVVAVAPVAVVRGGLVVSEDDHPFLKFWTPITTA